MASHFEKAYFEQIPLGKKKIRGRLVIPSGIRCAKSSTIERYFKIDAVGIITTKSISYKPKIGYKEPLYAVYSHNSYVNAVGLDNPGAEAFAEELSKITIPADKFLLVSIFGGDAESFLETAKVLAPYADGFELNMSCPHASGYGLQVGSDRELVARITKKVTEHFDIPVFVKLSGTIPELPKTAQAAMDSGAVGITVTNTIGPGLVYEDEYPILSNQVGGLSGEAIKPLGLKALYDIRQAIGREPVVIGMGGIATSADISDYARTGADFFGIGSALTNLTTEEAVVYLNDLEQHLIDSFKPSTQNSPIESYHIEEERKLFKQGTRVTSEPAAYMTEENRKNGENMTYHRCLLEANTELSPGVNRIKLTPWDTYDPRMDVAGRFFFLMLPGVGEKPFAVYSLQEREFIIKNVGTFTSAITAARPGETVYLRGPYGKPLPDFTGKTIIFVAGGTGLSPVYEMARKFGKDNQVRFYFGVHTKGELLDLPKYQELGEVEVATEDGTMGAMGYVTELFAGKDAIRVNEAIEPIFINVGPKPMLTACLPFEKELTPESHIWAAIEYHTSCGVGICGKCANTLGYLTCVDGPFLPIQEALLIPVCQHM